MFSIQNFLLHHSGNPRMSKCISGMHLIWSFLFETGKMVEMWSYFGESTRTPELATWVGHELGGLAPHQCRWAGVVWAPRCRDLRDGLLAGVGCSSLTLRFSWTVTLIILGLGFLRARILRLYSPLLSLQWCVRCLLITESPKTPYHYRYQI